MTGRHVKVMGKAHPGALADAVTIRTLLSELVHRAGMRMLGDVQIHDVECDVAKLGEEPFEDEGGVTGVAVLSTSHCAIHTWPLRSVFVIDLYSCRHFEQGVVLSALYQRLGARDLKVVEVDCGYGE